MIDRRSDKIMEALTALTKKSQEGPPLPDTKLTSQDAHALLRYIDALHEAIHQYESTIPQSEWQELEKYYNDNVDRAVIKLIGIAATPPAKSKGTTAKPQ